MTKQFCSVCIFKQGKCVSTNDKHQMSPKWTFFQGEGRDQKEFDFGNCNHGQAEC